MAESVRTWRTAFLSVRDEILTSPPPIPLPQLLQQLLFSHSHALLSAALELPPHEVTSDLLFLMEMVFTTDAAHAHAQAQAQDLTPAFPQLSRFIHDICHRVPLQLNSSSWTLLLDSLRHLVDFFITRPSTLSHSLTESLATLRCLVRGYHRKTSTSDDVHLLKFLLHIIASSHPDLISSSHTISTAAQRVFSETGTRITPPESFWELQTIAFMMLAETISRVGPSFAADIWKSTIEVIRKMMDVLASKNMLVEDNVMTRYYAALLHSLHLVLVDPKGSLSDHVSSFVAALRMFFTYGINGKPQFTYPVDGQKEKELSIKGFKSPLEEPKSTEHGPYRPPHLRKKDISDKKQAAWSSQSFSDCESSRQDFVSSDSDYSDSDGSVNDTDSVQKLRVRIAALDCIKDLCQADSKSFTSQWMLLLPTSDVLQPRKFEATLMTCLLFDPYLKARIASASTLAVMLDGPSSVFLQIAEYKETSKSGSFTALSISLGHILMQLHTGILHLIQRENHGRMLVSLFKILMLLISSTPYPRMPGELLSKVITCLQKRIEVGFPFKNDQTGLLTAAISCLTVAFTTSPSSLQVKEMLLKETYEGFLEAEKKTGVLFTLFHYSEQANSHTVCLEALQALRAVSHNYPVTMFSCWERVSTVVYGLLRLATPEVNSRPWKANVGNTTGLFGEKIITAAIKVLDECLRAISGFKGTEDLLDDKLLETPFTSDYIRMKKVSSAPSYEQEISEDTKGEYKADQSGILLWCETLEKHMPLILRHTSAMVGLTST
ncbi:Armadillo-type fold containing protein [Trema orientale]|uniref:Armadillo-type fold containing protein n=1 Tax=Trema orientale TaxID=63057 RepID=A0A2P5F5H7_TREOI|nr:Armadillo-type fold containing protein [Trema orientale]